MNLAAISWPVRVYYEDTDATGVVYHAAYLRFFERARTEWLRALGYSQERLRGELGMVFTVAGIEIEFRKPARLDDALVATAAIRDLRRASFTFEQQLYKLEPGRDAGATGALLTRASVRCAAVDHGTFRPCALPRFLAGGADPSPGSKT
jgi:acyl-CoA thioester hydrolase